LFGLRKSKFEIIGKVANRLFREKRFSENIMRRINEGSNFTHLLAKVKKFV